MANQKTRNQLVAITTSSSQISSEPTGELERTMLIITNTDTANSATVAMTSDSAATASAGIILGPGASYTESTDSGFTCWDGAIQAIGNTAGLNLAIVERFAPSRND